MPRALKLKVENSFHLHRENSLQKMRDIRLGRTHAVHVGWNRRFSVLWWIRSYERHSHAKQTANELKGNNNQIILLAGQFEGSLREIESVPAACGYQSSIGEPNRWPIFAGTQSTRKDAIEIARQIVSVRAALFTFAWQSHECTTKITSICASFDRGLHNAYFRGICTKRESAEEARLDNAHDLPIDHHARQFSSHFPLIFVYEMCNFAYQWWLGNYHGRPWSPQLTLSCVNVI